MLESFIAIFVLAALLVSWTLWSAAILRLWTRRPLLAAVPRHNVPWGIIELIVAIALFLVVPGGTVDVLGRMGVIPIDKPGEVSLQGRGLALLVYSLATLAVVALTLTLARLRTRATWNDLGVSLRKTPEDIVLGSAAFFMLAPVVYLIMLVLVQWFASEHPLIKLVKANPDPRFFALSIFSAVIVAPIVEEFAFRVLLQGWLEKLATWSYHPLAEPVIVSLPSDAAVPLSAPPAIDPANPYSPPLIVSAGEVVLAQVADESAPTTRPPPLWPMFVSAAIFAAMHIGHGPDPIPLFVLALGLGYLYRQTHRVLPGIVVHMLLNATSMLFLLLSVYGGQK